MKPISRLMASTFTAVSIAATAQTAAPPPLPGPVTYVTQAQYDQLLQEGKIKPVNAKILAQQKTRAEEAYHVLAPR